MHLYSVADDGEEKREESVFWEDNKRDVGCLELLGNGDVWL